MLDIAVPDPSQVTPFCLGRFPPAGKVVWTDRNDFTLDVFRVIERNAQNTTVISQLARSWMDISRPYKTNDAFDTRESIIITHLLKLYEGKLSAPTPMLNSTCSNMNLNLQRNKGSEFITREVCLDLLAGSVILNRQNIKLWKSVLCGPHHCKVPLPNNTRPWPYYGLFYFGAST